MDCIEALLRLLSIPLRSLGLAVLSLAEYVDLLHFLPWESQKQVGLQSASFIVVGVPSQCGWSRGNWLFAQLF